MGTGEPSERWYGQQAVYRVSMGNFVSSPRCLRNLLLPVSMSSSDHAVLMSIAAVTASMQSHGKYTLDHDIHISSPLLAAQYDIQSPAQPFLGMALAKMSMEYLCPKRFQALHRTSCFYSSWQREQSSFVLA